MKIKSDCGCSGSFDRRVGRIVVDEQDLVALIGLLACNPLYAGRNRASLIVSGDND
jgi:hypothetical protein